LDVYLEIGTKRIFAGALDWPGWCRSARDEGSALETLEAYAPRYAAAVSRARQGFKASGGLEVVERLQGNATTDFGAPGIPPSADERPMNPQQVKRHLALLRACWKTFDKAVDSARGKKLRAGPRGGGRALDAITSHVFEADGAYLTKLGGKYGGDSIQDLRSAFTDQILTRAPNKDPGHGPRGGVYWWPRYAVRRSAWHALDHAWEIEDRSS
jgi:hypothetical protein